MSFPVPYLPTATTASSPSYDGNAAPDPTAAGTSSVGSFDSASIEVLQGVPAPVRIILPEGSNPTLTKLGPQQYFVSLSLSSTVQLTPGFADAQQNEVLAVAPNSFAYVYSSRNSHVATVDGSGLVTAVGRGEATILIGSARTANLPFTNAQVPAGLVGCEVFAELTVLVVG